MKTTLNILLWIALSGLAVSAQLGTIDSSQIRKKISQKLDRRGKSQCYGVIPIVPTFNHFPVTFDDTDTPLCHDFPVIDVAKDTTNPQFSNSLAEYQSIKSFSSGGNIVVLLYINNGAASNYDRKLTTARNVRITTALHETSNIYTVSALFSADGVESKAGIVKIKCGSDERIEVIAKSGYMYDFVGKLILDQQNLDLGNSTFLLGDLDADWEYSLFLTYKLKVVKIGAKPA